MGILRFPRSLNANLITEFQNSKWRIQYGRPKVLKLLYFYKNRNLKTNLKTDLQNHGSNIAGQEFKNSSIINF